MTSSWPVWLLLLFLLTGCSQRTATPNPPRAASLASLLRQNRLNESLDLCVELLTTDPNNPYLLLKLGQTQLLLDDRKAAEEAFYRVLQIDPNNRDAKYFLARTSKEAAASPEPSKALTATYLSGSSSSRPAPALAPTTNRPRATTSPRRNPRVEPSPTAVQQLFRGLAQAHMKDHEDRIRAEIERSFERVELGETPAEDIFPPRQPVRADLGLGLPVDVTLEVPTTGHPSSRALPVAAPLPLRFGLVGQNLQLSRSAASTNSCPPREAGSVTPIADQSIPPYRLQCQDGRDNNRNLLVDRHDPACWRDPTDPTTYSPYLDESIDVPVEVAPSAVSRP